MLKRKFFKKDKKFIFKEKAQTLLEYTTIIVIVSLVLMTMQTMVKRAIQGTIKTVADQIGNQEGAEQDFSEGFLNRQIASTKSFSEKRQKEFLGNRTYTETQGSTTDSMAVTDMGVH